MRIGFGYDLHRLVHGRKLMIGGVQIPSDFGEAAHSDGDVLLHAIIDALFGAIGDGDIGSHFPPGEELWKNADSLELLKKTMSMVERRGFHLENMDCTVVLENPRLLPHRERIKTTIAEALNVDTRAISIKGKTKEKVDAVGKGEAIEAYASILLEKD